MKTISAKEIAKEIETTGKTLAALKIESMKTRDQDGCCKRVQVLPGLSVVWVENKNYQGGKGNGFGPGLYAVAQHSKAMASTWLLKAA